MYTYLHILDRGIDTNVFYIRERIMNICDKKLYLNNKNIQHHSLAKAKSKVILTQRFIYQLQNCELLLQ